MRKAKEFMWTRITECFLTLAILLAIEICPCHAQAVSPIPQELQKFSLGGLKGVSVIVAPFEASADGSSLRQDLVQTDTEIRLRKAGINVVETQQFGKQLGKVAILYIELQFIKEDAIDRITYSILVSAVQPAKPLRESLSTPPTIQAATWIDGVFGHVASGNMATIRQSVGDIVDKFTNDYLASNPKQGARVRDITPHTARSNTALHRTHTAPLSGALASVRCLQCVPVSLAVRRREGGSASAFRTGPYLPPVAGGSNLRAGWPGLVTQVRQLPYDRADYVGGLASRSGEASRAIARPSVA